MFELPEVAVIILFFTFFVISFFVILLGYQNEKWRKNKKWGASINKKQFSCFENIIIQAHPIYNPNAISMGSLAAINNECHIYIHKKYIIIILAKPSSIFFRNYYPIIFEKNIFHPKKIIKSQWNNISIHTSKKLWFGIEYNLKLFIKPSDEAQRNELYNLLNEWMAEGNSP